MPEGDARGRLVMVQQYHELRTEFVAGLKVWDFDHMMSFDVI